MKISDEVEFRIKSINEIMDEADYPGVRVSVEALFDGTITPLKIDISTGDVITPREVRYSFQLMLEKRSIEIWAYQRKFSYANELEWREVMKAVCDIYQRMKLYDYPITDVQMSANPSNPL